jgi:hypothetical protein
MTARNPIKVDLTEYSLEKLLMRHADFVNFTASDPQNAIDLLNQKYRSAVLRGVKHTQSQSKCELDFPNTPGVFYLQTHPTLQDVYIAETFKPFQLAIRTRVNQKEVDVEYSLNAYTQKKNRPLSEQQSKEARYLAKCIGVPAKGKTLSQIHSELSELD